MARDSFIISTTGSTLRITEKDGTEILSDTIDAIGNWTIKITGNADLTNAASNVTFYSKANAFNTGAAGFDEVTSVLLVGVEELSNYSNWQDLIDGLSGELFVPITYVNNLGGLALASHQTSLNGRFGEAVANPADFTLLKRQQQIIDLLTDIKAAVEALAATIDTGRILVTDQH